MNPVAVLYATREGHTKRIAEFIGHGLNTRGLPCDVNQLSRQRAAHDLSRYAAVVVASPVHVGKHAPEALVFVKSHRADLERMRSAFVCVTLSQAGVQRANASAKDHQKFVADVRRVNERFFAQTGWHPTHVVNVAGALLYTRYNFLIRFVMKRIARASGGSTDTTRDHDFTDWAELDRFVSGFAVEILSPTEA